MTINGDVPSSLINNHPPLAYDAQGCKLPVPEGTTHWRILRHTPGRPRVVVGPDMQPGRFGLDLTAEQLLEMCGPGKYRIEALDEVGRPLGCVTTVSIGIPGDEVPTELVANNNVRTFNSPSDTRFMLETLAHMSRAHSESLQTLANAQADWIKTLATAKQIPRNAQPIAPLLPAGPPIDIPEPEPWWAHLLKPQTLMAVNGLLRNLGSWFGVKQEAPEPPKRRSASALAQIAERVATPQPTDDNIIEWAFQQLQKNKANATPPTADKPSTEKSP